MPVAAAAARARWNRAFMAAVALDDKPDEGAAAAWPAAGGAIPPEAAEAEAKLEPDENRSSGPDSGPGPSSGTTTGDCAPLAAALAWAAEPAPSDDRDPTGPSAASSSASAASACATALA